uniref:Trypsin-like peptidase domain-containing protein n=1 Tax=Conchiformibius kuhniae TaxID=211502 RepID=A0A8T9MXB4_9NEIS|nr:trypsin-like peptidase domain-containing protein [Conchiformibius kuhniae]
MFQYGAQPYLLLTTGSAYVVSKQGHLLTAAAVAADVGGTEVFYTDKAGMRYNGGDGKVRAFVVTAVSPKLALLPADTVLADGRRGLAVLAVKDPRMLKGKPVALADAQFAERGTPVFAVGMEGVSDQLAAKRGAFDEAGYLNAVSVQGMLERHVKSGAADAWEHGAQVQGSMRGGTCSTVADRRWQRCKSAKTKPPLPTAKRLLCCANSKYRLHRLRGVAAGRKRCTPTGWTPSSVL